MDFRRSSVGIVDATIIPSAGTTIPPHQRPVIAAAFSEREGVEKAHATRNKLTLRFSDELISNLFSELPFQAEKKFGIGEQLSDRAFLIDFCDPNANKALHVGHLRNLVLGHALASLFRAVGGNVTTQSVICDIGRNVCEAIAGYLKQGSRTTPETVQQKPDSFVGSFYSDFVNSLVDSQIDAAGPDAPIVRELVVKNDLAQEVLDLWRKNDVRILALWRQMVDWVLEGHRETLSCLGIEFDRLIFESESVDLIGSWINRGLREGIFVQLDDGAVAYPTGREDYGQLLLTRTDGFPTEHMRAIPLWASLQEEGRDFEASIHVMGNEWLSTTELREELIRKFEPCPLYDHYHKIGHGMVALNGSKMKSSTGDALLIDDLIERLVKHRSVANISLISDSIISPETIARISILGYFLSSQAQDSVDFAWEKFVDPSLNPGMILATAWAEVHQRERFVLVEDNADVSENLRYVILQSHRLKGFVERSIENYDPRHLVRFLCRVAGWYLEEQRDPSITVALRHLLGMGLEVLGIHTQIGNTTDENVAKV